MRNSMDAEQISVGWWPGDERYPRAAFYGYVFPAPPELQDADVSPGRWDATLGEFLLDWDDVVVAADPFATALGFAQAVARHGCTICGWDPSLARSLAGDPPPMVPPAAK